MYKVFAGDGYCLGEAEDVTGADGLVIAYAGWFVSQGDVPAGGVVISYWYMRDGQRCYSGTLEIGEGVTRQSAEGVESLDVESVEVEFVSNPVKGA